MQTRQQIQYTGQPNPGATLPLPITGLQRPSEIVARFLAARTTRNDAANVYANDLYRAFECWVTEHGHARLSPKAFSKLMRDVGYHLLAGRRGHLWLGLYLDGGAR